MRDAGSGIIAIRMWVNPLSLVLLLDTAAKVDADWLALGGMMSKNAVIAMMILL